MDQCDSLVTKLITMLLDWYSGEIDTSHPTILKSTSFYPIRNTVPHSPLLHSAPPGFERSNHSATICVLIMYNFFPVLFVYPQIKVEKTDDSTYLEV